MGHHIDMMSEFAYVLCAAIAAVCMIICFGVWCMEKWDNFVQGHLARAEDILQGKRKSRTSGQTCYTTQTANAFAGEPEGE